MLCCAHFQYSLILLVVSYVGVFQLAWCFLMCMLFFVLSFCYYFLDNKSFVGCFVCLNLFFHNTLLRLTCLGFTGKSPLRLPQPLRSSSCPLFTKNISKTP